MITQMKVISAIKKSGVAYAGRSSRDGAEAQTWSGMNEIRISYNGGDYATKKEALLKMADYLCLPGVLEEQGTPVHYWMNGSYGFELVVLKNHSVPPSWVNLVNRKDFVAGLEALVTRQAENMKAEQAKREAEKIKRNERNACLEAKAAELNPGFEVNWLQGNSDYGIGNASVYGVDREGQTVTVHILFSSKKEEDFFASHKKGQPVFVCDVKVSAMNLTWTEEGKPSWVENASTSLKAETPEAAIMYFVAHSCIEKL